MDEKDQNPLIREAIKEGGGSQAALADRCGCVQQHISKLLKNEIKITAEMAVAIEKATGGKVPRWRMRDDLWSAPEQPQAQQAAE